VATVASCQKPAPRSAPPSADVDVLAADAKAATTDELVRHTDIVVRRSHAPPFRELPGDPFAGKILIDAIDDWGQPVDGDDPGAHGRGRRHQRHRESALALGASGQEPQPARLPRIRGQGPSTGAPDRIAVGAAGDDRQAARRVMRVLDRLGFDPVEAGPLRHGVALQPDGWPIADTYSADRLSRRASR
jgi:8-hydroxy-5-deazaflavin:NADPH oxidoreductase